MSSEVSIVVRARDMATRVLRNIGSETQKLSKGLGFGGLAGGLAKGGAAFGLGYAAIRAIRGTVESFREIARLARETGDYTLISDKSIKNAERVGGIFQDMKDNAAITAGRVLGWFGGGGDNETNWRDEAARVAERDSRIAAAHAGSADIDAQSRMDADKVGELLRRQTAAQGALAGANPNDRARVAELEYDLKKATYELNKEIARQESDSIADQAKALSIAGKRLEVEKTRLDTATAWQRAVAAYEEDEQYRSDLHRRHILGVRGDVESQGQSARAKLDAAMAEEGDAGDRISAMREALGKSGSGRSFSTLLRKALKKRAMIQKGFNRIMTKKEAAALQVADLETAKNDAWNQQQVLKDQLAAIEETNRLLEENLQMK